jgi:hypothetical protein
LNDTTENVIKFQIIHFPGSHAIFGEFQIDKTNNPPIIKYLHCDPLPRMTKYDQIITSAFTKEISPLANIEIYDSGVTLQRGLGCSYFSIDGAMMLATPPDRTYVSNVMEHMKTYGVEKKDEFSEKNIKYVHSSSLPTRFIRGLQYIDGKEGSDKVPGLYRVPNLTASVFNTAEKDIQVNKKGQTAEEAIRNDLIKNPDTMRTFNMRAERKMKNYGKAVAAFMDENSIIDPAFPHLLEQYKMTGLTEFCQEKISPKNKTVMKP